MIYISKMVNLDDLPLKNCDFKMIYLLKMVIFHSDFPYFFCMFTRGYPVPAEQFLRPGNGMTPVPAIIRMPAELCCWALGVQGYKRFTCLWVSLNRCIYYIIYIYIMPWLLVCMCFKIVHAITYIYIYICICIYILYVHRYVAYVHIDIHICIRIHIHTNTCMHACMHTDIHTHIPICM